MLFGSWIINEFFNYCVENVRSISGKSLPQMTSFSQIFNQELEQRKINGGAKFSEIKVQKTRVVILVIDWNLAR